MNRNSYYVAIRMDIIQIGILLQIIGTFAVVLIAGVFLAPEIMGSKVPAYITHALTEFASKLQQLVPEQFTTRVTRLRRETLGPIVWLMLAVCITSLVLANRTGSTSLLVIGVVTGVAIIFLLAWVVLLPLASLKAAKQRGIWSNGKFTPTEPTHLVRIGFSHRFKLALRLLTSILLTGLFWVVAFAPLIFLVIWHSVTEYLATEKAPRTIALIIGLVTLITGLMLEFSGSFSS